MLNKSIMDLKKMSDPKKHYKLQSIKSILRCTYILLLQRIEAAHHPATYQIEQDEDINQERKSYSAILC